MKKFLRLIDYMVGGMIFFISVVVRFTVRDVKFLVPAKLFEERIL